MYNAKFVLNSIIDQSKKYKNHKSLDRVKAQNLLYFLNGWCLAVYNERIVKEDFIADNLCPLIPELDIELLFFKKYYKSEFAPIDFLPSTIINSNTYILKISNDDRFYELLDIIMNKYMKYTSFETMGMTIEYNSPWWKSCQRKNKVLLDSEIKEYFVSLVR